MIWAYCSITRTRKTKAQLHYEKAVELWGKLIALKPNKPEAFVHLYRNCLKAS
jgi:hypothetical protein